ncbi:hypothetical protein [uncultured Croceitalea sp.]|uniref:hypothetical protein n=1 Tax=uncultured Croceitalea sp. TaxID=1798908 RepID=UPI0033060C8C
MNKIKSFFGIVFIALAFACEGPQGPSGFDGRDGEDGLDAPLTQVFQETVDFTYDIDNNIWRSNLLTYDGVVNGDVYLVYISFENGFYTPLPASVFDEFGEFQYIFDHDVTSVELQIIGDSDLSGLDLASTEGIPVRVVILPAELRAELSNVDVMNFESLMFKTGLDQGDIQLRN